MPVVDRDSCHNMIEVAASLKFFSRYPVVPKSLVKCEWETSQGFLTEMERKHREYSGLEDTVGSSESE